MDQIKSLEHKLAENARRNSDYIVFNEEERKELIMEYVKFISELGFTPIKVFGKPDPEQGYSFRAIFEFERPNMIQIVRRHKSFFEASNWSEFSLISFKRDVLDTTTMSTLEDFKKMIKINIWHTGYTDEELLCAILGIDQSLEIKDVIRDGKLIIPPQLIDKLFFTLNTIGANQMSPRIIKRKK